MAKARNPARTKGTYVTLKKRLTGGRLSLQELHDTLMGLDQATPDRDASEENLVFLRDANIVRCLTQLPIGEKWYHWFASFTEFHVGQRHAMKDSPEALAHFERSLMHARCGEGVSWVAYVEGTILYMKGKRIPRSLFMRVKEAPNVHVLRRLNAGLKKRGCPSYGEDYPAPK